MSEDHYISEEREEEPAPTEVMDSKVFTEEMTPVEKMIPVEELTPVEKMIPLEESPATVHEEKLQEQNRQIEKAQEESSFMKKTQRRRVTTYLSHLSKQVEKNGNEINKITTVIQSLQKQINLAGVRQSQSIKQVRSQLGRIQKQVTRIQKDIQRIRTAPATKARTRKSATSTKGSKSKTRKSATSTRLKRSIR
jgi:chromosome segregation ATPase